MAMDLALTTKNLRKIYTNGHQALGGIDLTVNKGDFFALLGPNGAGKSTLIGVISSLVKKTSGSVKVFDIDIDEDFPAAKAVLGLVPQEINFSLFETVEDIIRNQAGYYGIEPTVAKHSTEKYLKKLELWDRRKEISRNLSGGMKRRLMIARALVNEPKLLILDEPTAGVDIEVRRSMYDFLGELNESGTTIILTTHYLEEAEHLCRNIAIIDNGDIVENTSMKGLLRKLQSQSLILDVGQKITQLPSLEVAELTSIDDHTLEVVVNRGHHLNELFTQLSKAGIRVRSMRNKTNRLEELFLKMVANSDRQ